jgi:hypothetical protein
MTRVARVSGEPFDCDPLEWLCCVCGLNEYRCQCPDTCLTCEGELDEHGWCADCEDSGLLTECLPDPLLKRKAA